MKNKFSPIEEKLVALLKKLKGDSVWHYAIKTRIESKDEERIRDLFLQLKSEGKKAPNMMMKIIGTDVYQLLLTV